MKLVRRRLSVEIPEILATPMSFYEGGDPYQRRVDALCDWAGQHATAVDWEQVALFVAEKLLPGMLEGEPRSAGRPRRNQEFLPGPRSAMSRAEGKWLVRAVEDVKAASQSAGEKVTVLEACSRLKVDPASKARIGDRSATTLRRLYYEQRNLELTRQKVETARSRL